MRIVDEKMEPKGTAEGEERETLHKYVGGVISNPRSTKKTGQEKGTGSGESRTDTSK